MLCASARFAVDLVFFPGSRRAISR